MEVRTLFFASYRDLIGAAELPVHLDVGATVSELVSELRARGTPFDRLPEDPAIAVNHAYVDSSTSLSDGDEVAFIPPVAGG